MLIDRHIAPNITKYPLVQTSECLLFGVPFPYKDIFSLSIQSSNLNQPYISAIKLQQKTIRLQISISDSSQLLYCNIAKNTSQSFIISQSTKTIAGSIVYSPGFYSDILALLKAIGTQLSINIGPDTLRISMQCVKLFKPSNIQNMYINDHNCSNAVLYLTNNVQFDQDRYAFNLFGDCPLNQVNFSPYSIKKLIILGNNINNQSEQTEVELQGGTYHLIIKPAALSDLRIQSYKDKIKILGAIDA